MRTALVRFGGVLLCVAITGASAGCDPTSGSSGTTSASTDSTAAMTSSSATAQDPPPPPPDDLDVAAMQKSLACPAKPKEGPCAVLEAMKTCTPWDANVPSGDGRWIGRGFEVDGKKTTEEVTVLRLRRVGTSEVGPGQIPGRIGLSSIDKSEGAPFTEAGKAIRQLERSDVAPKGNAAVSHLKAMTQWSESFATRTKGGHIYGLSQGGLFVCQGPKRELLVLRKASTRSTSGDGLYATVWAATW